MTTSPESVTERNRAAAQALYDAAIAADMEKILSFLSDDLVIEEPDFLPYAGTYKGKSAFPDLFGNICLHMDMTQINLNYLIVDGDRVVANLAIPDTTNGELTSFFEESIWKDGKIVAMKLYYFNPQTMLEKAGLTRSAASA